MFKRRGRAMCFDVLRQHFDHPVLMADRNFSGGYYYSVWSVGHDLMEATCDHGEVKVYRYKLV